MGEIRQPGPVLLLTSAFSRYPEALEWARERTQQKWGPLGLVSELYDFFRNTFDHAGIGMALGARPRRVLAEIVLQSLRLVAVGTVLGCALSVVIAKVARSLLFGVSAFDPLACGVVALFLAAVGLLACWAPARRAASVDPVIALRAD